MKVGALREVLQRYSREDLALLVVELYKATPKKIKEAKAFDQMILDVDELKKPKRQRHPAPKLTLADFEDDLVRFLDLAEDGAYGARDPRVTRGERKKWRHVARRFYKSLMEVQATGDELDRVTALMKRLYVLLSRACYTRTFRSEDPFKAIQVPQHELYATLIHLIQRTSLPRAFLSEAVWLIISVPCAYFASRYSQIVELLAMVSTPDMLELLLEVTEEATKRCMEPATKQQLGWTDDIQTYHIQLTADLYLMTSLKLHEPERGIAYFKEQYVARDSSSSNRIDTQFELLDHLERRGLYDLWLREYEATLELGVEPLEGLLERHQKVLAASRAKTK